MENYILDTGKKACNRLEIQNCMLQSMTEEYLTKAGIKDGMIVCDIGCGNGVITEYLSRQVGKNGKVYAIDINDKQLNVAKERIKTSNNGPALLYNNVDFIQADITSESDMKALNYIKADIIHIRLVLMHLKDPTIAIRNMKNILLNNNNGIVVSWESIMNDSLNYTNLNVTVRKYIKAIIQYGKINHLDYNLGSILHKLYKDCGYNIKEYKIIKVKFPIDKIREHHKMMLNELQHVLLNFNLLTQTDINTLKDLYDNNDTSIESIGFHEPLGAIVLAQIFNE